MLLSSRSFFKISFVVDISSKHAIVEHQLKTGHQIFFNRLKPNFLITSIVKSMSHLQLLETTTATKTYIYYFKICQIILFVFVHVLQACVLYFSSYPRRWITGYDKREFPR